jgi:hypothetical membrane protein
VRTPEKPTDAIDAQQREHRATGASLIALILALVSFAAMMLLHVLRGDVDPIRQVMSEYANGSHGRVMTVVFYACGVSSVALAVRLRREFDSHWAARLIPVLLALAGLGLILAGIFEVERPSVPDTLEELIHSNASITAFVLLITAMFLLSIVCRTDARWQSYRWASTALAVTAAAAAIATPFSAQTGWSGAVQRVLGLAAALWLLLTALHVRGKAFRSS